MWFLWKRRYFVNQIVTEIQHNLTYKIANFLLYNLFISAIAYIFAVQLVLNSH